MYILGINLSHDRSACLVKDGQIVVAIAEERLDRIKKSSGHMIGSRYRVPPMYAINYCLKTKNIKLDDIDLIVADNAIEPVNLTHLGNFISIKDKSKIIALPHPSHHLAHAYSAYYCSPFKESAILIADAYGSEVVGKGNEGESGYIAVDNKIEPVFKTYQILGGKSIRKNNYYYSLTFIYRFITLVLGFYIPYGPWPIENQPDEAGKTMALAAYGNKVVDWPSFVKKIHNNLDTSSFASWAIKCTIANNKNGRLAPIIIRRASDRVNQSHKNLAYKVQKEFEKGILILANKLYEKTKSKNLCIAGGAALNCLVNSKIIENTPFKNLFVQPAATDDGNAIGCAMYGWHKIAKGNKRFPIQHMYFGRKHTASEIKQALKEYSINKKPVNKKELIKKTAQFIAEGKIVGWFQEGSEFGPRALGHRSILADPRNPMIRELLNKKVKHREVFQPYATSIMAEYTEKYFDIPCLSPFMLLVSKVKKEKYKEIPAVIHVDNTIRLQTVTRKDNGFFYNLLKEFYLLTKVPLLLNTSFNTRGNPIVESPFDALKVFFNTELDILVIDNFLLNKEGVEEKKAMVKIQETKHMLNMARKTVVGY